jgi:hypothetical protein
LDCAFSAHSDCQHCQAEYVAWEQQYAGSTNGNTDQGLGAHFSTKLNICLIEEHYTRFDGTEMYDVFDASKIGATPYILEFDIENLHQQSKIRLHSPPNLYIKMDNS